MTYLDGIQDNLLDFRDRTRLASQARIRGRPVRRETSPEFTLESTPSLDAVHAVRDSRQSMYPTCRLTEAVHVWEVGGSEVVSRSEGR